MNYTTQISTLGDMGNRTKHPWSSANIWAAEWVILRLFTVARPSHKFAQMLSIKAVQFEIVFVDGMCSTVCDCVLEDHIWSFTVISRCFWNASISLYPTFCASSIFYKVHHISLHPSRSKFELQNRVWSMVKVAATMYQTGWFYCISVRYSTEIACCSLFVLYGFIRSFFNCIEYIFE